MKIDLRDEIQKECQEQLERQRQTVPEFEEIEDEVIRQLTPKEREILARRYKEFGNEHFQAQEYQHALLQYNASLRLNPTVAAHNNRAITYLKLKKYKEALEDCEKCLDQEPGNIKALIRKAQAYQGMLWRQEAYEVYCQVLKLDKNNTVAHEQIEKIRHQLPKLPPPNTTRIKILDESSDKNKAKEKQKVVKEVAVIEKPSQASREIKTKSDELDQKEKALLNFKTKMKEQKLEKEKFKEQMKQMICEDVILLPHHDKRKKEFIIEESKG